MIILSVPCLVLGIALAGIALRCPKKRAEIEIVAGYLIVGGLLLIGFCLPLYR